jgi:glutathione-independent formaldehyde dehydrogenase
LLATYSAILQGAGQVFVVDYIPERLELAKNIGAIPINFTMSDPVAMIETLRSPARRGGYTASRRGEATESRVPV